MNLNRQSFARVVDAGVVLRRRVPGRMAGRHERVAGVLA